MIARLVRAVAWPENAFAFAYSLQKTARCGDQTLPFKLRVPDLPSKAQYIIMHPIQSQLDDIGCTKDKCRFGRQIWNPQIEGRGLMRTEGQRDRQEVCLSPAAEWARPES